MSPSPPPSSLTQQQQTIQIVTSMVTMNDGLPTYHHPPTVADTMLQSILTDVTHEVDMGDDVLSSSPPSPPPLMTAEMLFGPINTSDLPEEVLELLPPHMQHDNDNMEDE